VRLRTGWFSDRTATYLASGRPAVTQDTGFGIALPTGEGLFSFDSFDSAAAAVEAIDADYARHARAAREIGRECFGHEAVLRPLLEHLDVRPAQLRPRRASSVFPPELVVEPVSRRPTALPRETVEAAQRQPTSRHPEPPAMGAGSASVVVVTYDGLPFTRLCLETVLAHGGEVEFELIVVDNGSGDGTPEYLTRLSREDARVRVLLNGRNAGFAVACNQGLSLAGGDHLVLLNNDTMVPPGWLEKLVPHLSNPEVGLVGPVTNRIGNEAEIETDYRTWGGFLQFAARRAEKHAGDWIELRSPAMFCLAVRRQTYLHLGGLDERYEVGLLEDDDYADRARAAGYELRCIEDLVVHHFGEASFGKLVGDGEYHRILRANQQRYAEKWGKSWQPYGRRPNPRYERETQHLREVVCSTVPPDATVLVVSRGDEALLELDGRAAKHFPQAQGGGWAGHHPADSEEAIGHLEALRGNGATYLVVPPTYRWWLSFYEGLRDHLERRYQSVHSDEKTGEIFLLEEARR
jgi:GT2 family glycosyltransferase